MRRDPLQVLRRLRDATMNEASRELANGLQRERRGHGRVLEPGQAILREQVDAGSGSESALFGREVMPSVEHRNHKGLNNRAENSHQPTRRRERERERQMKRFKSAGQVQRFLSAHDGTNNLFRLRRQQVPATQYRAARIQALQVWVEVTGVTASA